jgi:hypothetical protein
MAWSKEGYNKAPSCPSNFIPRFPAPSDSMPPHSEGWSHTSVRGRASNYPRRLRVMKITELLLAELDREAVGTRKTLQRVPEGKNNWKTHEKSMPLGNLATIVANMPGWVDMVVDLDELDINPPGVVNSHAMWRFATAY